MPEHFVDDDIDILDERRTEISTILKAQGDSVAYIYDLGDDWRHEVVLEKFLFTSNRIVRPICLSGEHHCPPEDVGGTSGYEEFLEKSFSNPATMNLNTTYIVPKGPHRSTDPQGDSNPRRST